MFIQEKEEQLLKMGTSIGVVLGEIFVALDPVVVSV